MFAYPCTHHGVNLGGALLLSTTEKKFALFENLKSIMQSACSQHCTHDERLLAYC